jgi:succinyl-CoA synthetase beta subunit
MRLHAGFVGADATLFEVNPLIQTTDGRIIALDSKVSIDGNAQFRQEDLFAEAETGSGHPLEVEAKKQGLQYVKLDGDIGVMGNGAGLVMSTLDVVAEVGGHPANFLDAGGGASAESMAGGIAFVLSDPDVKVMLVNIFGGITRCDDVANGIVEATRRIDIEVPLVIRLTGSNEAEAVRILEEAGFGASTSMDEVVQRAVELAGATAGRRS